ncbi:MAG: hypothetical protein IJQ85_06250 [Selenomonadaceae bacterium]|nr:hypothetical protein [Selenomonadaceae bacterium]
MKKFFNFCMAIFVLCAVIFPAKTFAADDPNSEGIKAFREALTADATESKDNIFRQDIFFASPLVQGALEVLGMIENDAFKSTGEFSLWINNDDGTVTDKTIPFYMTQIGKDMTIYFKADKKWEKFTTPTLAAGIMDMVATPTDAEIEEIIADTKEVTILQENENRRIMLIKIDGDRMADSFKAKVEENPDPNSNPVQEAAINYFDTAFRNADMWYMWTIDKRDWHTIAMQYQFSGFIQELARAILNDPNQQLPDEINQLLETVAYYSEIRAYTTYLTDPAAKKVFEIPKNVLKAKEVDSLVPAATK